MHWLSPFFCTKAILGPLVKRIKKRLTSIDMRLFRGTTGYTTFAHKMNEEILEGLKVVQVDEKLRRYTQNLLRHVTRMNSNSNKNSA
jgi:Mg2+ and Co2+ transporter CorA